MNGHGKWIVTAATTVVGGLLVALFSFWLEDARSLLRLADAETVKRIMVVASEPITAAVANIPTIEARLVKMEERHSAIVDRIEKLESHGGTTPMAIETRVRLDALERRVDRLENGRGRPD